MAWTVSKDSLSLEENGTHTRLQNTEEKLISQNESQRKMGLFQWPRMEQKERAVSRIIGSPSIQTDRMGATADNLQ